MTLERVPADVELGEAALRSRREHVLAEARRSRTRRTRLVSSAAAAMGVVLAAALFVAMGDSEDQAFAATPAVLAYQQDSLTGKPARELLLDLAAKAEEQPVRKGRYSYVQQRGWSLVTSVRRSGVDSRLVESTSESWTSDDGAGEVRTTEEGTTRTSKFAAEDSVFDLSKLPPEPGRLAEELAKGHPTEYGAAERIVAVIDVLGRYSLSPRLQGALLRVLAEEQEIVFQGRVVDRAGRRGVAVGVDSDYAGLMTRYTLILDPRTGGLLGKEDTLTRSPGKLNVKIPAVISYNIWLKSGRVNAIGSPPN